MMSTGNDTPDAGRRQRAGLTLPAWLDGRTIALLTTMVTLGAMMQTAHSRLASDIDQVRHELSADIEKVRDELSADIEKIRGELSADIEKVRGELSADMAKLDDRLRSVEIDVAAIRAAMVGFDGRLRTVEERERHPAAPAG